METVADVLDAAREREGALFVAHERATPMTAAEAVTSAWQMGNLLRHYGVRPGERVAVVSGPTDPDAGDAGDLDAGDTGDFDAGDAGGPDAEPGNLGDSPVPILAILGALAAGGTVDLDPPGAVDATALVLPAAWLDDYRTGPGTTAIAYGDDPDEPGVAHLEREAWSENPTTPPVALDATSDAVAGGRVYAHADLVTAAHRLASDHDLAEGDRVALAAPLTTTGALVAGVLAPMVADATVVLGDDADGDAALVVAEDSTDATHRVDPATVLGAGV